MKIYTAAPWQLRDEARRTAAALIHHGHIVTSRWLQEGDIENHETAQMDLDDIDAADALLAINPLRYAKIGTGGRHVEFGYALARGKRLFIRGVRSNIFHHHERVHMIELITELPNA